MQTNLKDIVTEITQAFTANTPATIWHHYHPHVRCTWYGSMTPEGISVAEGLDALIEICGHSPLEDGVQTTTEMLIQDGDVVMGRGSMKGRLKTGEPFGCSFCDIYHFEGGKVAHMYSYVCDLAV
jgi:SnoaL-like domain